MPRKLQIEELKQMLLEKKELIEQNIKAGSQNLIDLNCFKCPDESDFADISSNSWTQQQILKQQKNELNQIEEALKSIEDGTYGICQMCDEPIPIQRLKAKPFAKYCTTCREIYEKEN